MSVCANYWECNVLRHNGTNFSDGDYPRSMMLEAAAPQVIVVVEYLPWIWAMMGSILVGLSGVLPLLVIPIDQTNDLKEGG